MDEKEKAQAIEREQHALDDELIRLNSRRRSKMETINFMTKSANMPDSEKATYVKNVNETYLLELNNILTSYKEKGVETETSKLLSKTLEELKDDVTLVDKLSSINQDTVSEVKENTNQEQTNESQENSSNDSTPTDNDSSEQTTDTSADTTESKTEPTEEPKEDSKKKKHLFGKKHKD